MVVLLLVVADGRTGASLGAPEETRIGAGTQSGRALYVTPCECAHAVAIARAVRPEAPIFA
jgi:hypothetical protein